MRGWKEETQGGTENKKTSKTVLSAVFSLDQKDFLSVKIHSLKKDYMDNFDHGVYGLLIVIRN